MHPLRGPLGDEGLDAFDRVPGFHQLVEIQALDGRDLRLHARRIVEARRAHRMTQRAGALGPQMRVEIAERRAFGIGGGVTSNAHGDRLGAADAAAREQQIERAGRAGDLRQQAGRRRREHAELDLRLAERGLGMNEQQVARHGELEPAAQALAAHRGEDRDWRFDQPQHELVNASEHAGAVSGQMLLDARPEAEMRTLGVDQSRRERRVAEMLLQGGVERGDHRRIDQVRLRPVEAQTQQPAFRLEPDAQRLGHDSLFALGMTLSVSSSLHGVLAASARRSAMKSISRPVSRVPSLKARNPARASVIMLSASQAREFSLLRFQASSLGLRNSSSVLVVQSGKVSSSLAQRSSTLASSRDRSTEPFASSALPSLATSPVLKSPNTIRPYSSAKRCVSTSGLAM